MSKIANCKDFVNKLPDKINTIVGERGMKPLEDKDKEFLVMMVSKPEILILMSPLAL